MNLIKTHGPSIVVIILLVSLHLWETAARISNADALKTELEIKQERIDSMLTVVDHLDDSIVAYEVAVFELDRQIDKAQSRITRERINYEKKLRLIDSLTVSDLQRFFAARYSSDTIR